MTQFAAGSRKMRPAVDGHSASRRHDRSRPGAAVGKADAAESDKETEAVAADDDETEKEDGGTASSLATRMWWGGPPRANVISTVGSRVTRCLVVPAAVTCLSSPSPLPSLELLAPLRRPRAAAVPRLRGRRSMMRHLPSSVHVLLGRSLTTAPAVGVIVVVVEADGDGIDDGSEAAL